jgi:hypothetical protein
LRKKRSDMITPRNLATGTREPRPPKEPLLAACRRIEKAFPPALAADIKAVIFGTYIVTSLAGEKEGNK